ncbi:putative oxalocrotonate tautomerase [Cadophora sp. MPI-SDFR-AT-0126]|nr:putative oxalocrotonate tautomerase [Leotiomycetes sp. MPI-SDFR-AT-0126]
MPLVRIHHPVPRTFTDRKERKAFADDIVNMYTAYGIPAFYVVVLFIPIPDDHVYVGGRSDERANADPNESPMVRIVFDHIARTIESPEMALKFFEGVDVIFKKHILDKGHEVEYHLVESPREFCKMNGMYLPPNDSEAEAVWAKNNRPGPFEGMEKPMASIKPMYIT